jgi:hypothetical protein
MLDHMSSVLEIERALKRLPREERWEVARWLLDDLHEATLGDASSKKSESNSQKAPSLPDYSARRRRIFGSKVLPNIVLAARAEVWLRGQV